MYSMSTTQGCAPSAGEMIYPVHHLRFRSLRADEVSVLPVEVRNNKVRLLLYKDARADRKILNEAVGELNWQSDYFEEHGMLFCKVGIRNPETSEWTWKTDTGSESNIEAGKGLASDAFKRACFAFGIGEELYTAPEIRVDLMEKDMYQGKLSQTFSVSEMSVEDGCITSLSIVDKWNNKRFEYNATIQSDQNQTIKVTMDFGYGEHTVELDKDLAYLPEGSDKELDCDSAPNVNEMLKVFYENKKRDPNTNMRELDRFYGFFTQRDKNSPDKTIAETWKNFKSEQAWEWWLKKIKN